MIFETYLKHFYIVIIFIIMIIKIGVPNFLFLILTNIFIITIFTKNYFQKTVPGINFSKKQKISLFFLFALHATTFVFAIMGVSISIREDFVIYSDYSNNIMFFLDLLNNTTMKFLSVYVLIFYIPYFLKRNSPYRPTTFFKDGIKFLSVFFVFGDLLIAVYLADFQKIRILVLNVSNICVHLILLILHVHLFFILKNYTKNNRNYSNEILLFGKMKKFVLGSILFHLSSIYWYFCYTYIIFDDINTFIIIFFDIGLVSKIINVVLMSKIVEFLFFNIDLIEEVVMDNEYFNRNKSRNIRENKAYEILNDTLSESTFLN